MQTTTAWCFAKMFKTSTCVMTKVFLLANILVLIMTTSLSIEEIYEGQSAYYLITNSRESLSSDSFKVYNALDEFGCMSLCTNKEGCSKGVYDHDKRSCFLEMDGCKKRKLLKTTLGKRYCRQEKNSFCLTRYLKGSNGCQIVFKVFWIYSFLMFAVDATMFCRFTRVSLPRKSYKPAWL